MGDRKDIRIRYGRDFDFTFEWCRKYKEWKDDDKKGSFSSFSWNAEACDPPHTGLIASLQKAKPSLFKHNCSIIEREANVWDDWSSCHSRKENDMGIYWFFTRIHLRPVARYIAVRKIFAKRKAR